MNKKTIIAIIILVVVIGGAIGYMALQSVDSPTSPQQSSNSQTTPAPPAKGQETPKTPATGTYAQYDAAALATTPGRKLLFFHAAWCPQCRNLEKTILEGKIPSGVTIFKVNYDSASALRQKYGVTLQTTIVEVDRDGNALKKHVAYDDPTLPAVLKAFGL